MSFLDIDLPCCKRASAKLRVHVIPKRQYLLRHCSTCRRYVIVMAVTEQVQECFLLAVLPPFRDLANALAELALAKCLEGGTQAVKHWAEMYSQQPWPAVSEAHDHMVAYLSDQV